jgi:hypothetical protein
MARDTNIIRNFDALAELLNLEEIDEIIIGRRRGQRGNLSPRRMQIIQFIIQLFEQSQFREEFCDMLEEELEFESIGNGEDVFDNFTDKLAQFKTITAGSNVTLDITTNPGEIIISAAGAAGPTAKNSIEIDAGDLQLVNDLLAPGNNFYYGTDGTGTKGYHALPVATPNTDETVKASPTDPTAGYLDAKVKNSVEVDADQIQLDGDSPAPGPSRYYGTNAGNVKGFHDLPAGATDELVKGSATDPTAGFLDAKVKQSIEVQANQIHLVNDEGAPTPSKYYGTDGTGTKGYHSLPAAGTDELVKASATDPTAGTLDAKVKNSVEVDAEQIQLDGDAAAPGNDKYYGTDAGGTKGFFDLPTVGGAPPYWQTRDVSGGTLSGTYSTVVSRTIGASEGGLWLIVYSGCFRLTGNTNMDVGLRINAGSVIETMTAQHDGSGDEATVCVTIPHVMSLSGSDNVQARARESLGTAIVLNQKIVLVKLD